MINFASDNYAPTHPQVMQWLNRANNGPAQAYGNDTFTTQAQNEFKKQFGDACDAFFVWNGTSANVLSLGSRLKSFQSVLCSDVAHITMDECGAPERHLGSKLALIPNHHGKIMPGQLEHYFHRLGDVHSVQPKILSLTQATEYGTIYQLDELKALVDLAHSYKMLIHLDGARLANAAVTLKCSFKAMTTDLKIDLVSFGGTKNGLMGAEAVVFPQGEANQEFAYIRKQGLHLASKMRYLSAQFLAYFENDLWKTNASHANSMAQLLGKQLSEMGGEISVTQPVQANGVFVSMPKSKITELQKKFSFYTWNEQKNEVRLMCSFNTTAEEVNSFVNELRHLS